MRDRLKGALKWVRAQARVPLSTRLAKWSDAFELAGIGCLVGAVWLWSTDFGLAALGVALIYLGWVTHESS